jgi:hypothetical protein
MASKIFDPISIIDHHKLLASHNPQGKFWELTFDPDDDFGKLFLGLAYEFYRFQVLEKKLYDEMDINQTNELLVDWEKSVGIPDTVFFTTVSLNSRKLQVLQKFSKFGGVQKNEDFVRVAQIFGISVFVQSGNEEGTIVDTKTRAHTIFVDILVSTLDGEFFPLPFPVPFGYGVVTFVQTLFDKLAPANVQVIVSNKTAGVDSFVTEDGFNNFISESGEFFVPE